MVLPDTRLVIALCIGALAYGVGCDDEFTANTETEGAGGGTLATGGGGAGGSGVGSGGQGAVGGSGGPGGAGGAAPSDPICDLTPCSVKTITGPVNPLVVTTTPSGLLYADRYRVYSRVADGFKEVWYHAQVASGFANSDGATYWVVGSVSSCSSQRGLFRLFGAKVNRTSCGTPRPGPQLDAAASSTHVCSAGTVRDPMFTNIQNYTIDCWDRATGVHTRNLEVYGGGATTVGFESIVRSPTKFHAIGTRSNKLIIGSGSPVAVEPFDSLVVNTSATPKVHEAEFFEGSIWWIDIRTVAAPTLRRIAEVDIEVNGIVGEDGPATAMAVYADWLYVAKPDGTIEARRGTDVRTLASFGVGVVDITVDGTGIYAITDDDELRWLEPAAN